MPDGRNSEISGFAAEKWSLKSLARSSQIMLGVLALLLIALGAMMFRTINTQREARAHVFVETEAIFALGDMLRALVDAETGERGYLLAGQAQYLQPLEHARIDYAAARRQADRFITHSEFEDERFDLSPLDRLVAARMAVIDGNLDLVRQGRRGDAISLERSAIGKASMDAVRKEIARVKERLGQRRLQAINTAQLYEKRMAPLLALIGVAIAVLVLIAVLFERRHAVAATKAQQAEVLRVANERTELVARELNHRVKNLFAVVLSIVSLTGRSRNADRETMNELRARIHALSIAHAASQGQVGAEQADLSDVIQRILAPYADTASGRVALDGPGVMLPVRMVTPLGLICHELATNAVKYGAFSASGGKVRITWSRTPRDEGGDHVVLSWIESGGPALDKDNPTPTRAGFGSTMLDLAARQLGGSIHREWRESGVEVQLEFTVAG
ncbi:hypothetical protein GCM10011614_05020 [Novosphingobium colocasiae]|uniref:histidine kinase n=1 Tax=Novosphingobium colocasiae TaxID=1256513 RepID=A0A918P9R3_9SPHN|nr:hypothetical protein GCM10011614_05020 [Novosphingobium colocasiae]